MQETEITREAITMKKPGTMLLLPLLFLGLILNPFFIGCGGDESIEEVTHPCALNPCGTMDNTASDSCLAIDAHDFTCECDEDYIWNGFSNQCVSKVSAKESCDDLKSCLKACDFDDPACQGQCYATMSGNCLCTVDLANLPEACLLSCGLSCMLFGISQACYECGVICSMNQCRIE